MKLSAIEYRSVNDFGLPAGTVEAVFRAAVTKPSMHEAVEAMIRGDGDGGAKAKALVENIPDFIDCYFAAKWKTGLSLRTVEALLRAILLTDLEELEALATANAAADTPRLSKEQALWAALVAAAAATGTSKVVDVAAIERRAGEQGLKHGE